MERLVVAQYEHDPHDGSFGPGHLLREASPFWQS